MSRREREEVIANAKNHLRSVGQQIKDAPATMASSIHGFWDGTRTHMKIDGVDIDVAVRTDPRAWITATDMVAEAIERGEPVLPQLRSFAAAALRGEIEKPPGSARSDWRRDLSIILALQMLQSVDIRPNARDGGGGIGIVAKEVCLSDESVRKIWKEREGVLSAVVAPELILDMLLGRLKLEG